MFQLFPVPLDIGFALINFGGQLKVFVRFLKGIIQLLYRLIHVAREYKIFSASKVDANGIPIEPIRFRLATLVSISMMRCSIGHLWIMARFFCRSAKFAIKA